MKTFKDNLADFEKAMGFSRLDVLELSELNDVELDNLESGNVDEASLVRFCLNAGIDYRTLFADTGFKSASLEDQFASYPIVHQKAVTKLFLQKLKKRCKLDDNTLRLAISSSDSQHMLRLTRLLSGSSTLDTYAISTVKKGVSNLVSEDEFNLMLAQALFTRIPNYNYNIARNYFKLTYKQIANGLEGTTVSGVSNWGGSFYSHITQKYVRKLAAGFGGLDIRTFSTQLMSPNMLKGKKCEFSLSQQLIDPPEIKCEPKDQIETDPVITVDPEVECEPVAEPDTLSIEITDETALKMYSKLNANDRLKVNKLISDLFINAI